MNMLTEAALTIAMGIIGVAALSVLVSRNANTTGVIQASASGFGNSLAVATSPVTGSPTHINLSYPTAMGAGVGGFSPSLDIPAYG